MTRVEYREEIKSRKQRTRRRKALVEFLFLIALAAVLAAIVSARTEATPATELTPTAESTPAPTIRPPVPETPSPWAAETPAVTEREPKIAADWAASYEDLEPLEAVPVASDEPEIDGEELEMLACAIYTEAGGDDCSDICRRMVGDVVLNRMADPRFPDTMEAVLTQEGQYGTWHWTGIEWPERANHPDEAAAVARAYDTARSILGGEHSDIYGQGYVWEAEFSYGRDVIQSGGLYFGR